jgi:hypothetical protein
MSNARTRGEDSANTSCVERDGKLRPRYFRTGCLGALVLTAIGVVAIGAWHVFFNDEQTNVTARLRLAFTSQSSAGQFDPFEYNLFKNTQKELLLSPSSLSQAIVQCRLARLSLLENRKDPADWLGKHLRVSFLENSEIMEIRLPYGPEEEQATIINAAVDTYINIFGRQETDNRIARLRSLHEIRDKLQGELRNYYNQTKVENVPNSEFQEKMAIEEYSIHLQEVVRSKNELGRLKAELEILRANQNDDLTSVEKMPISDKECEMYAPTDILLSFIRQGISDIQSQDSRIKKNIDPSAILRMKEEYSQRINDIRSQLRREKKSEIAIKIKQLEVKIAAASLQSQEFEEGVKKMYRLVEEDASIPINLEMEKLELNNLKKSYERISEEIEKASRDCHAELRITLMEKAEVPVKN